MFEHINELAVIGCTLFMLAVHTLWYAAWRVPANAKRSEFSELLLIGSSLLVMVSVLAYIQSLFMHESVPPFVMALVAVLFSVPALLLPLLFEGKKAKDIAVHAGYIALFCAGTVYTLYYWPW